MSIAEYRNMKPSKPSKYRNKRVILTADGTLFEVDELKKHNITDIQGIKFDSKMEAEYYLVLQTQLNEGIIQGITLQPKYILQFKPRITYKADFQVVYPGGDFEVIDVKGMQTKDFKLKKKLFAKVWEDYKLKLVTKKGRKWIEVSS